MPYFKCDLCNKKFKYTSQHQRLHESLKRITIQCNCGNKQLIPRITIETNDIDQISKSIDHNLIDELAIKRIYKID